MIQRITVRVEVPPGVSVRTMEHTFELHGDEASEPLQRIAAPPAEPKPRIAPSPQSPESLPDLYERLCGERDELQKLRPASVQACRNSVQQFHDWLTEGRPDESPLTAIAADPKCLQKYASGQVAAGASVETVRKKCGGVRKLLAECVSAGLLKTLPESVRLITPESELPETVTLEEMLALRDAAESATWPCIAGFEPWQYWQFCIDACWTYGFRLLDWFSYKATKPGLLWEHVCFDPVCPAPQMKGCEHASGWVWFPVAKAEKQNRKRLLPLSQRIRDHLETWRGADAERVVPLKSGRTHNYHWQQIVEAAGVDSRIRLSEGRGIPSFRKGCSVHWEAISEEIADYVLGHRAKSMRGRHYGQTARKVCQWVESVPFSAEDAARREQILKSVAEL